MADELIASEVASEDARVADEVIASEVVSEVALQ